MFTNIFVRFKNLLPYIYREKHFCITKIKVLLSGEFLVSETAEHVCIDTLIHASIHSLKNFRKWLKDAKIVKN